MYLDSSVMVKLFATEPDSDFFVELTDEESISSSVLAFTEVYSALLMKQQARLLTSDERHRAWSSFETMVEQKTIHLASFQMSIFKKANRIMEQCSPKVALRSLDALHLATCDQLQDWPLCTTDVRMRQAAELLQFPLSEIPPG
ncbi:MAG: type II toxin-antitoxin system VapC family toxin [Verrucomicrobiota bacterium]